MIVRRVTAEGKVENVGTRAHCKKGWSCQALIDPLVCESNIFMLLASQDILPPSTSWGMKDTFAHANDSNGTNSNLMKKCCNAGLKAAAIETSAFVVVGDEECQIAHKDTV